MLAECREFHCVFVFTSRAVKSTRDEHHGGRSAMRLLLLAVGCLMGSEEFRPAVQRIGVNAFCSGGCVM